MQRDAPNELPYATAGVSASGPLPIHTTWVSVFVYVYVNALGHLFVCVCVCVCTHRGASDVLMVNPPSFSSRLALYSSRYSAGTYVKLENTHTHTHTHTN